MGHNLKFATIMAPANEPYEWWWGLTGEEVGHKLQASKMQLRNISAYVDLGDTVKFTTIMGPPTGGSWWWYWGLSGEEVGARLSQNKAQLTDISPYIAPDGTLRFAVIMVGQTGKAWWWYWDQTGDQVGSLLQKNKAVLTKIRPYLDHGSLRFAVIMAPNVGQTWWWWGQTGQDIGAKLTENKAELTDIAVDPSDNRFAVVMTSQTGAPWWWWVGLDAQGLSQKLSTEKARPTLLTPYFDPPIPSELSWTNLGTGSGTTSSEATKCSYTLNLTIQRDGTCHFWGSYTNRGDVPLITAPSQTFGVSIVVLDSHGKGYSFSAGGHVPSAPQAGSTYSWNRTEKSAAIAANWEKIATRHYVDYGYSNQASISDVISEIENAVQGVAKTVEAVAGAVTAVVAVVALVA